MTYKKIIRNTKRNKAKQISSMRLLNIFLTLVISLTSWALFAQNNDQGRLSGSLEANGNFFISDPTIGATNTPQYDHQLFGADSWLNLQYNKSGYELGIRFDIYNNSILPDPKNSFTGEGIGHWFARKKVGKLGIEAGHIYDQIGSGIIFRSYELRPLFIDNGLVGLKVAYDLNENWQLKAMTGRQKKVFETYGSNIRAFSIDGYIAGKEGSSFSLSPGFGVVARTYSDDAVESLLATMATYTPEDTASVTYNGYAFSVYNTLSKGAFSWYIEGAYKTPEVFYDLFADRHNWDGSVTEGKFVRASGSVLYSTLSFAKSGFGISLEGKRTENFTYRANPFVQLNRGIVNFLPPMTRINAYRLTTRYQAATQELGEMAFQADISYKFNKKFSAAVNFSNITNLENDLLYREIYSEFIYKYKRKWSLTAGLQLQSYNQEIYEVKPGVPTIETVTPYFDFLYKLNRKKAIRFEGQYMAVGEDAKAGYKQDYGDWLFGLAELTLAPHWTFTVSDMYNVEPGKNSPTDSNGHKMAIHYPRFDVYYTHQTNRFYISYVKQVEGIVCSGGICRLEPAFSGVKVGVNSTF